MYAEGRKRMAAEGFMNLMQCVFDMSDKDAGEFFLAGQVEGTTTIDLGKFDYWFPISVKPQKSHIFCQICKQYNSTHSVNFCYLNFFILVIVRKPS